MYEIIRRGKAKRKTAECVCDTIFIYDPGDVFLRETLVCSTKGTERKLRRTVKCPICGCNISIEEEISNERS